MKALINKNGCVMNTAHASFDVHPDFQWVDAPEHVRSGHLYHEGRFIAPSPVSASKEPSMNAYETETAVAISPKEGDMTVTMQTENPKQDDKQAIHTLRLDIHIHVHQ